MSTSPVCPVYPVVQGKPDRWKYGLTCKADIVDNKDFLYVVRDKDIHEMQVNDVAMYIVRWLGDGPRPASEILSDATSIGYNEKTTKRAIRNLMDTRVIVSESAPEEGKPAARQYRLRAE